MRQLLKWLGNPTPWLGHYYAALALPLVALSQFSLIRFVRFDAVARISLRTVAICAFLMKLQIATHHHSSTDSPGLPRLPAAADKLDPNVGTGLVGAPACGDVMKLQIRVDDDGNIVDSCFKTFGRGPAAAPRRPQLFARAVPRTSVPPLHTRRVLLPGPATRSHTACS
jgi:hypothetical protein